MTSSNDKPAAAAAPVFSYAQAARGLVSTTSSVQSSRGTSGAITPAKDAVASPVVLPETPAWTDNTAKNKDSASEPNELSLAKSTTARKSLANSNGSISPPSSAYVDSSMSTLPREDDLSSIPNASSESTWENVSTASNAAERGSESDKKPEINGDASWVQVSKPSPQPTFNFWEQRSKERAAKKVVPDAPAEAVPVKPAPPAAKAPEEAPQKEAEKPKREQRNEEEPRGRKPGVKKPDEKPAAPPALNDTTLWPTVETALVDRKKPDKSDKPDKPEKSDKDKPLAKKTEWKKVEVQHSVVFNTPLPSNRGRGGRPAGRGGREGGTRSSPGASSEKHTGDSKARSASPGRGKRIPTDDNHAKRYGGRDQKDFGDRPARQNSDHNGNGTYSTFPRSKANRKLDTTVGDAERRKDGRIISDLSNGEGLAIENANPPNPRSSQVHSDDERRSSTNDGAPRSQRNGAPYTANRRGSLRRHGPPHGFHGTPSPAFQSGGFNMARSPTLPHDGYYTPGPGNRIRGQRNMPGDNYGRFGAPYSAVLPQINTFMGQPVGVFDFQSGHPVSAGGFQPYFDQYTHIGMVANQLEYYFSISNLCHDLYLRGHMDSQGFVLLSVIANFNRIKDLNSTMDQLKTVCQQSQVLEWRLGVDGKDRIRKREGWDKWVLDKAKRDPSAQHDGVEAASPPAPIPETFVPVRHSSLPNSLSPHMSPSVVMVPMNGSGYPDMLRSPTGESTDFSRYQASPPANPPFNADHSQAVKAPGYVPSGTAPAAAPNGEHDISDAQVENLVVMSRQNGLPNGKAEHKRDEPMGANGASGPSGAHSHEVEEATPGPADMDASYDFQHPRTGSRHWGVEAYWARDRDSPVFDWPEDATGESYMDMRARALGQRQDSAADDYPDDMVVLYQFWSHFLVRHFNTRMFLEFRHLAVEDKVERGVLDGMQSLVKYFNAALLYHAPVRDIVLIHLLKLIETERESGGQMPAFSILRSAWRNGTLNPATREKIVDSGDAELLAALDP